MGRKYFHHLLTDGQLDFSIADRTERLNALADELEALIEERERRGGLSITVALRAPAIGWLAAGEGDLATGAPAGAA